MYFPDDDSGLRALGDELQSLAPEPEFEYFHALERMLKAPAPKPRRRARMEPRLAVAGGLTVALVGGLGATGSLSYAASSVAAAARVVTRTAESKPGDAPKLTSARDQYRPGFGWGDPNHAHSGPPGLGGTKPGAKVPPAQTISAGKGAAFVVTSVAVDEQADLSITIVDAKGRPLSAKPLGYRVLVPRAVPLKLRVPTKLLARGGPFRIRIVARDPQGNRSTLYVPFPGVDAKS